MKSNVRAIYHLFTTALIILMLPFFVVKVFAGTKEQLPKSAVVEFDIENKKEAKSN